MQDRHVINQHLGFLLLDHHFVQVEPGTLDLHSGNVPAVFGLAGHLRRVSLGSDLGVDGQLVQFQRVLFAELLAERHHLTVRNVDAREPGAVGLALDPLVVLLDASAQVHHPGGQFLVGLRREFLPGIGDEAVEYVVIDNF